MCYDHRFHFLVHIEHFHPTMNKIKHFLSVQKMTSTKLIVLVALFLMVFANAAFFSNVTKVYPINLKNIAFLCSLAIVFGSAIVLLLSLFSYKYTIKPVLIAILFISAVTSYLWIPIMSSSMTP